MIRCALLDLGAEHLSLQEYCNRAFDAGQAAIFWVTERKTSLMRPLYTILKDWFVVLDGWSQKCEEIGKTLCDHPYDDYRKETFKLRDENGVPIEFEIKYGTDPPKSAMRGVAFVLGFVQAFSEDLQFRSNILSVPSIPNNATPATNESGETPKPPTRSQSRSCCVVL